MAAVDKRHPEHLTTNTGETAGSLDGGPNNGWNVQSHVAIPNKRPRVGIDPISDVDMSYDEGTRAMENEAVTYGEIIGERVIMPHRLRRGGQNLKEKTPAKTITSNKVKDEIVQSRYNEPKKYKYFREMVERSCNLTNWRLQEKPCAVSCYGPCIVCATVKDKNKIMDCRFHNRMLRDRDNPRLCRRLLISDIERIKSTILLDEVHIRMEQFIDEKFTTGKPKEKAEAAQMAAYVLQCVCSNYKKVVRREEEAKLGSCPPNWLNPLTCLNGHSHDATMFHLGSFLPSFDIFKDTLCRAVEQVERYGIKKNGALCNGNHGRGCNVKLFQEEKCYCPQFSPLSKFPVETVCVIKDQFSSDAYARFKAHLAAHNPIIVENVNRHPQYRRSLWTQEAFEKIVSCDRSLRVLDSRNFSPVMIRDKPCSLKMFWSKFGLKRGVNDCYMKIKDFPESKLFSNIAPEQYVNLYEIMPFLDYTHINREESGRGRLNLLNLFSDKHERPDPGPKAYICFGLYNAPHLASTPLHLDVSDAVNFLPFVKAPDEMSRQEVRDAVEQRLDAEGFSGYHRERALREPEKAGAIWKIFHPTDNGKIRAAIEEWKRMKGEEWKDDVIHNQDVVVTREMMDFFEEKGIKCRMFVQNEGDVVFIPSGAAHQVQNINSCIKIAEDFVAGEGIDYTVAVTDELRFLRAKDDLVQATDIFLSFLFLLGHLGFLNQRNYKEFRKFQVDKLLHLACAAATAVLQNTEPALVTSSLPQ
uniref:JmjC domain-containing protein n=1 Tax=Setaria digitata TaxID=48799 RepID=A0A915PM31_9BILA